MSKDTEECVHSCYHFFDLAGYRLDVVLCNWMETYRMYTTILDLMLCMLVAFSVIIYAINTVKILALYLRYSAHEGSSVASGKQ